MQLTAVPGTPPSFTTANPPLPEMTWSRLPSLGSSRSSFSTDENQVVSDPSPVEEGVAEEPQPEETAGSDTDEEDRYAQDYPEYDPEEEYDYHYDPYDEYEEVYFKESGIW